ncbi:MAG: bacteriophage abortive infection AbiH family protein [Bacteroidales bacterium]|jgi:regulator of sigma D|nr:bacteriophage abortive infection AbiH family protein [Bacteroidales bacterium]
MDYKKLYIIGNGFDLYHGIKSSICDLKDYVKEKDFDLYDMIEKYFGDGYLWSNFEECLGYIHEKTVEDEASMYLMDYGSDDWSDAGHHDYQYEVNRIIDNICNGLKKRFSEWIRLMIITQTQNDAIKIPKEALYLSFNYTNTLEKLYYIKPNNIVYIHGKAIDDSSDLIYGHNRVISPTFSEIENKRKSQLNDWEQGILDEEYLDTDPRISEGKEIIRGYYEVTFKNVNGIIEVNTSFFDKLSSIDSIYILGHSLNDIDLPYFRHIYSKTGCNVTWHISWHKEDEKNDYKVKLKNIGVCESKIKMIRIDDFSIEPKLDFKYD